MRRKWILSLLLVSTWVLACTAGVHSQIDEICVDSGVVPSLDSPFAHIPYVFGRITLKGFDPGSAPPKVAVVFAEGTQAVRRLLINKSGNYCFRRAGGTGTLMVEVNGLEVTRRTLPSFGASQQREDFEILASGHQRAIPPGTVSAKFSRPPNEKTIELYKKAAEAEAAKDLKEAVRILNEIVTIDAVDFIAWAKLGSLHFEAKSFGQADAAFRKALELKVEYLPAWINVGQLRIAQKQYEAAVEILKHAASLDPTLARTFQLLGEAYLQARQGRLGVEALNKAIALDPIGMAECHLQLAHLYQLAGAKDLAIRQYKLFLEKVPNHPDKKKFEKYIKENS